MKTSKIIVTFSGGLDSTVLLGWLQKEGHDVKALSVNYGQRHSRELVAACAVASALNVKHKIADLSALRPLMKGSSQTSDDVNVPVGHYEEESMKLTVVPNRNMLLLAVAGAWAISTKSDFVAYAAHAGDHAIYPDCRESFTTPLAIALANADWHRVRLLAPFISYTKAGIVRVGSDYGLEDIMALSYSCYEGKEQHCGRCGTCTERKEAFQLANVKDPTNYVHT